MLSRNGENLNSDLQKYLAGKLNLAIFCPYIKASKLREILDQPDIRCQQIVVRWEPRDLAMGSSDIEIYDICRERNITLYMNNRIHLKLFTNNYEDAFLGSANLSERAFSNDIKNCNYEVNAYINEISVEDKLYLEKIVQSSTLIDDEIYESIKAQIPEVKNETFPESFRIPELSEKNSDFFITNLPMTESPELLWEFYIGSTKFASKEEENCFVHDLVLYQINLDIDDKVLFFERLRQSFFSLRFIVTFLLEVDKAEDLTKFGEVRKGLRFGAVRKWFSNNTTTVPSPRPFELTKNDYR